MDIATVTKELERISESAKGNVDAVQAEVKALKEQNASLVEKHEGLAAMFKEFEQGELTRISGSRHSAPRTAAGMFMKSGRLAELKDGRKSTGAVALDGLTIKTLTSLQGSGNSPQDGINVVPNAAPGLWGVGSRNLRLLDVMPTTTVSGNSLRYTRLQNWSNAAAAQAGEGAAKPNQDLSPLSVDAPIQTIAVTTKVAKQVMDDTGWLSASLDALMRYSLADELERQLIRGDGSDFSIEGLRELATAADASTIAQPDQIGNMIAEAQADGYAPDFLIVHPQDFQTWRAERSASDEIYVSGSWSMPAPPTLWNVPAVLSASAERGEVLAVHSPSVFMLDRQSPTVEIFEQNEDDARKNLLLIRAEVRSGMAVMDAAGVRSLTLI